MCSFIKISILLSFLFIMVLHYIEGLPQGYGGTDEFAPPEYPLKEDVQYCYKNTEHLETCQRCAKLTKSPIVYPLCCTNKEQALQWCQQYMRFGIQTETKRDVKYNQYEIE